jgi:hypothetical protein
VAIVAASIVGVIVVLGVIGAIAGHRKSGSNAHNSNAGTAVPVANNPSSPAGFTVYRSTPDQFTVDIPKTWKAVDPTSPGAQAAMNEIVQSNPNLRSSIGTSAIQLSEKGMALLAINPVAGPDGIAANINVLARPDLTFSAGDLSKLAAALPGEYAKLDATSTGISYVTIDGHQAVRATDTLPLNTPAGTRVNVHQTQYFIGANGFLYALTLSGDDPNMTAIASSFSAAQP